MTVQQLQQQPHREPGTAELTRLLSRLSAKRVIVVGTTCTGKSTMLAECPGAVDQDAEVFPTLSKAEADFVCQTPWTEEIGRTMERFVRERVVVKPGCPVFGTVVMDCDHIILLKISDELLQSRTAKRAVKFEDAKNMQKRLEENVRTSGIPFTEYRVG